MPEATFDWEDLTLEEIEFLEEYTGLSIDSMDIDGRPKGKLLVAMAYIARRRDDPDFTVEQARKMKIREANDALGAIVPTPPLKAAG